MIECNMYQKPELPSSQHFWSDSTSSQDSQSLRIRTVLSAYVAPWRSLRPPDREGLRVRADLSQVPSSDMLPGW